MGGQDQQYEGLKREDILNLQNGEVVRYRGGYLIVKEVDVARGVVTGKLEGDIFGVNNLSITDLEKSGIDIAKWQRK